MDLARLLRTDWGPGVNGLGAGESRVKSTLAEPVFNPGGAGGRRPPELYFSVLSCRLKFWGWQKTVLEPAGKSFEYRSSPGLSHARD